MTLHLFIDYKINNFLSILFVHGYVVKKNVMQVLCVCVGGGQVYISLIYLFLFQVYNVGTGDRWCWLHWEPHCGGTY